MAEIKKIYVQKMPQVKFVGRCYFESDKKNGTFGSKWDEWKENDLFSPLRKEIDEEPFEDFNSMYGLCRCKDNEPFQYWIGMFLPIDAKVLEGYQSITFDEFNFAVCWVCGKEPDIYFHCCLDRLSKEGLEWTSDKNGIKWCFERYVSSRYTMPDKQGNIILDKCFIVK